MEVIRKRILFGTKYRSIHNIEGLPNLGFLNVMFEQIAGEMFLVNEKDFFCETRQVFVTSNYHEIDAKFSEGELLQIEAIPTSQEWKEGDCRYVTASSKVDRNFPRKSALQIISANLPTPNERLIYTDTPPSTPLILVKEGDFIYGPFQTEVESLGESNSSVKLLPLDGPFPGKSVVGNIRKYKYSELESGVAHYESKGDKFSYLLGVDLFESVACEYVDFASDEDIIRLGAELLKKVSLKVFTKNEQNQFRVALSKVRNIPNNAVDQLQRFFNIASLTSEKFETLDSALHDYLNSADGSVLLAKHIDSREELYLRKFRVEKEAKLNEEFNSLSLKIDRLNKLQKELEGENQAVTDKLEQQNYLLKNQHKSLVDEARNKERSEVDESLQIARAELDKLKNEAGPYRELSKVKEEVSSTKDRLKFFQEQTADAKQSRDQLEDELKQRDEELRKRLLSLRPYIETISGMIYPVEELCQPLPHAVGKKVAGKDLVSERNKYIDEIKEILASKGRVYEKDFITNLLISIQQSFIVILSGLPGVGKTSLVKLLGNSKRLSTRVLNISVGRGWTSQRDLIGYFNPLSNRMIPAPTGFFNYIKSCQQEEVNSAAPLWVLLDEANLSAIEHYWAPFMGMADSESDKILRVSESDLPLQIPESLRFIGTINNDMTTESLSPRLIDRAPIITLEPTYDISEPYKGDIDSDLEIPPLSYDALKRMFDIDQTLSLEAEREAISDQMSFFQEVKNVLMDNDIALGRRCVISKRKENAVERYCLVAHPLMRSVSSMRALDYAISQHVLPLVQGSGEGYGLRLEKLLDLLDQDDFKISNGILQRIHEAGKMDMNSFSYFS